ncbi:hypothetical protein GYH30_025243 [Glycine max]|nr:hypothetical protein GYH30_025243 [Glycine max]
MKYMLLALLLLFALSLSTQPLLGAANVSPRASIPAAITSGKKLQTGLSYYIVPAMQTITKCGKYECLNAEGLPLASIGESCPLDVVVVQRSFGLPLSFSPVNPDEGVVIPMSTDLNFIFSIGRTICAEYSPVWKLDHFHAIGYPGWKTIHNWLMMLIRLFFVPACTFISSISAKMLVCLWMRMAVGVWLLAMFHAKSCSSEPDQIKLLCNKCMNEMCGTKQMLHEIVGKSNVKI